MLFADPCSRHGLIVATRRNASPRRTSAVLRGTTAQALARRRARDAIAITPARTFRSDSCTGTSSSSAEGDSEARACTTSPEGGPLESTAPTRGRTSAQAFPPPGGRSLHPPGKIAGSTACGYHPSQPGPFRRIVPRKAAESLWQSPGATRSGGGHRSTRCQRARAEKRK